jgi:hypothetical protein
MLDRVQAAYIDWALAKNIVRVVSPQSAFGLWCNNDLLLPHLRARAPHQLEIAEM